MPLNAKLSLTQDVGPWRNTLEGVFVAAKDDVSAVRNEMQTAAYALANLRSRYEQEDLERGARHREPVRHASTTCRWAGPMSDRARP